MPLANENRLNHTWQIRGLPAIENKDEGVFISFNPAAIATELNMWEQGMNTANLVYLLRSILAERESQQTQRNASASRRTGDEIVEASGRDTRVVVQELFPIAQRSVLISTYAIVRNWRSHESLSPG